MKEKDQQDKQERQLQQQMVLPTNANSAPVYAFGPEEDLLQQQPQLQAIAFSPCNNDAVPADLEPLPLSQHQQDAGSYNSNRSYNKSNNFSSHDAFFANRGSNNEMSSMETQSLMDLSQRLDQDFKMRFIQAFCG